MNALRSTLCLVALVTVGLMNVGCQALQGDNQAVCVINPTEGSTVKGIVHFRDVKDGVYVSARISGLEPNSKHGFHIHQWGDISDWNGKATGGHYDPDETSHHARPDDPVRHAGDLGNLEANDKGEAIYNRTITDLSVNGLNNPILGRAVIVHAKEDDFGQPTGNAGGRAGQGVIGLAQPTAEMGGME